MTYPPHAATNRAAELPSQLSSMAVFLLTAVCLILPSGYSIGAVILFLAGCWLLITRRLPALTKHDFWVIVALLAYALVSMLEAWWDGQGSRGFDKPSRFILAIPALLWVLRYPPKLAYLWSGIALGGISAGAWGGWQKLVEGVGRAQGHTHVIQFGNLSMLLGVLCMAGLGWAVIQRHRGVWVVLLLAGAAGGVLGSLFSGSRGGWVGFPIVLLVLYRAYGTQLSTKLVALYVSGENRSTSVGSRFEMWRGAAQLIQEKPLTGWGSNGYAQAMADFGEAGVISAEAAQYGHAHNEFIDAFAKRGVVGLAVLLAGCCFP